MISFETEAEIERLWKAQGIHTPGTIARLVQVHRDAVVRVLTAAGLLREDSRELKIAVPRGSILDPYLPLIDETLRKYPEICASRLFAMLKERGYPGVSPSHVREVVRARRPDAPKEAFLKLAMLPGEQAQVDWAHFGSAGEIYPRRKLYAFVMTMAYSRKVFLRFFLAMRMREFQQGFCDAFEFFGGIPRSILIDNLKSGVAERIAHIVRFNDDFTALARHYAFETSAANVRRGNEKGRVERAIRYVRDNFFVARTFDSLDDLNAQARRWCETTAVERRWPQDRTQTVAQAFDRESPRLMPLPPTPFPCFERHLVRVNKYAFVLFDGNEYGAPMDQVGKQIEIVASEGEVKLVGSDPLHPLAVHARSYQRGEEIAEPGHQEAILKSKSGARRHAGLARLTSLIPEAEEFVARLGERGENIGGAVSGLLTRVDTHGVVAVSAAVREVLASGSCTFRAVNFVLKRLDRQREDTLSEPADITTRFGEIAVTPHDGRTYDAALGVRHDEP